MLIARGGKYRVFIVNDICKLWELILGLVLQLCGRFCSLLCVEGDLYIHNGLFDCRLHCKNVVLREIIGGEMEK